jgi:allophanate hydrolase subunit 1
VRDLVEELFVLAIHVCGRYHHAMHRAPAGDNADLIELDDVTASELHAAAARVRAETGVLAVIPGHSSLYVIRGERGVATPAVVREPRQWRIPVVFDGEDLADLLARVSRDAFLARVPALRLTARYLGFRGGFAYLEGWPEEWAMPRRPTSRPVRRGTFAVAGNVAGFYPLDSPGGWNVLGHTDVELENALTPGDTIAIDVVDRVGTQVAGAQPGAPARIALLASPLTTVVAPLDWSRVARGLSPGGPFDEVAAAVAMAAVEGNVELLECAMTGPRVRFHRDAAIAWCTPDLAVRIERVSAGEERTFGRIEDGLRAYLAIGDHARGAEREGAPRDRSVIRAMAGPHDAGLREIECAVTPQLNRIGIRLRPLRELRIEIPADLRSIGMQCGTVQLHPDGSLVAMGPDHPVTGGYLQPMTVITSERWKLAQLMPGERVTLVAEHPSSASGTFSPLTRGEGYPIKRRARVK